MPENFQEYVLVFARDPYSPHKVLVIHKDTPAWQKGRLNLPGGKINEGEMPHDAAERELFEETGLECYDTLMDIGKITFELGVVHVFSAIINPHFSLESEVGKNEHPEWVDWLDLKSDPRLIPNLKIVIPLCQSLMSRWTMTETSFGQENSCTVKVSL